MAKAYAGRLKGTNYATDDSNGYDLGGHLKDAAGILLTGQMPQRAIPTVVDPLDREIKMQRLKTGSPEFQKELAQTKADVAMQQALDLEQAKIDSARSRREKTMGGGSSYGVQSQLAQSTSPSMPTNSPIGEMSGGKTPAFIQIPKAPKYDPATDSMISDYDVEKNPEYLDPEARRKLEQEEQQKLVAEDNMRSNSQSRLSAIQEAKRGAKFFGPMGEVPSYLAPSSLVGQYGERAKWENNVNQLLSQKVLNVMNEMKRASKTGATGFGALSEKELQILQSAATALKKNLDPKDAMMYLNDMEQIEKKFLGMDMSSGPVDNQPNIPSFASDQEALAYAKKNNYRGKVLINGEEVELGD